MDPGFFRGEGWPIPLGCSISLVCPQSVALESDRPRSIYPYSHTAQRLQDNLTSISGVVFFVYKSLLGIERQKKLKTSTILTRNPRSYVRRLIY